jgi:hypothetical protein
MIHYNDEEIEKITRNALRLINISLRDLAKEGITTENYGDVYDGLSGIIAQIMFVKGIDILNGEEHDDVMRDVNDMLREE